MNAGADVVVVGAGAVGLCCALELAEGGARVTLIDRGLPGAANSVLTGGGVRLQFGTAANVRLSMLAAPFWATFEARFGVDPLFRPIGYLFLAKDEGETAALHADVAMQNRLGVDSEALTGSEIACRWPALRRHHHGGAFRQRDGWLNQHRAIDGLVRGALAAGVDLRVGTEALAVSRRGGRTVGVATTTGPIAADAVVLTTGPWTGLLASLGLALPVVGRRHELLIVEPAAPLPEGLPWLIGVRDQVHLRPDSPGRALVGGFLGADVAADPDDHEGRALPGWRRAVLETAGRTLGVVDARAVVRQGWAGLYPSTPDRHPVIDRLGEGLYAAMGFSGTGLMHAPAAGRLIAELVCDGAMHAVDAEPLRASRFARRPAILERTGF